MAKYSTGGGGGSGDGDACELCGKASNRLSNANIAGAMLLVCPECAPHDDNRKSSKSGGKHGKSSGSGSGSGGGSGGKSRPDSPSDRKKRAARQQAKIYDAGRGDSTHWEKEGTNYERDRLPYLVSGYGEQVEAARQQAGLTTEELAADIGVEPKTVSAVEAGRATRAGVGGSVIRALEAAFSIELVDE